MYSDELGRLFCLEALGSYSITHVRRVKPHPPEVTVGPPLAHKLTALYRSLCDIIIEIMLDPTGDRVRARVPSNFLLGRSV